jgi:hypothetical protein
MGSVIVCGNYTGSEDRRSDNCRTVAQVLGDAETGVNSDNGPPRAPFTPGVQFCSSFESKLGIARGVLGQRWRVPGRLSCCPFRRPEQPVWNPPYLGRRKSRDFKAQSQRYWLSENCSFQTAQRGCSTYIVQISSAVSVGATWPNAALQSLSKIIEGPIRFQISPDASPKPMFRICLQAFAG